MSLTFLNFSYFTGIKDSTTCNFSKPINNDIYIYDSGLLGGSRITIKYGDTMNMLDWYSLHIYFGTVNDSLELLTLNTDYTYTYNRSTNIFTVTNSTGTVLYTRSNIVSIADLGIDFTISSSHNFRIMLSSLDLETNFILYGNIERIGRTSYLFNNLYGISDLYLPESAYYPVSAGDYGRMGITNYDNYKYLITDLSIVYGLEILYGINNYSINIEQTSKYEFYISMNSINTISAVKQDIIYNGKIMEVSFLLVLITVSLYPALLPCNNTEETINNRPVYEPWLIWGLYKLLYNKYTESTTDKYSVFCFDLSPNFGG